MKKRILILAVFILLSVSLSFPSLLFCNNGGIEIPDAGEVRGGASASSQVDYFATAKLGLFSYKSWPIPYFELGYLYSPNHQDSLSNQKDWDSSIFAGGLRIRLPIKFFSDLRFSGGYLSKEYGTFRYYIETAQIVGSFSQVYVEAIVGVGTLFSADRSVKCYFSVGLMKSRIFN